MLISTTNTFYKHGVFLGQAEYAYDFSDLNLVLFSEYTSNIICFHGYDLIT